MAASSSSSSSSKLKHQSCTVINPADCDLDFVISSDKRTGSALPNQEFSYWCSGARGNIGITGGKYHFGCEILPDQHVMMEDTPLDQQHVIRVGISRGDTPVDSLGETEHSFGYDGNGKFLKDGGVLGNGKTFGVGDTIVCSVDLERKPLASVEFSKNGKCLGPKGCVMVTDPQAGKPPWDSALFPHVLLKNTAVRFRFSMKHGLVPGLGYKSWDLAMKDGNAIFGPDFSDPKDCEVIMLVGLPGSGKTTWAEKKVKTHPEKRYILLGTDLALDRMKVPSLSPESDDDKSYDQLMVRATVMVNILCSLAAKIPRNYIIDDCNNYKDSRREKLKHFASFHKVAVVVFPGLKELMARVEKRSKEIGEELSFKDVYQKLVTFSFPMSKEMPETDEDFDEVIFTDLSKTEAQQHLGEMKRDLFIYAMKSPYPHDSSVNSGTGHSRIDFSEPSVALSSIQPFPDNVNTDYTAVGQPHAPMMMQPISDNYNSYVHDSYGTHEATRTPGAGNHVQDPRSDDRPPPDSQHGTPNPMPRRRYPADGQHHGTAH